MRPFTAENFISYPATVRWKNRSRSPTFLTDFAQKQVRTLVNTNNVSVFIEKSPMKLEASNLNSVKKLDRKEIQDQLMTLKSRFNFTRKRHSVGDTHLKDLERFSNEKLAESLVGSQRILQLTEKIDNLLQSITLTKEKQGDSLNDMQIYWHVYERTKKSQIFMEIRSNRLKDHIKKTNFIVESERRLQLKTRSTRTSSQHTYRILRNYVESDTKKQQSVIGKVSKTLELRELLLSKREDRKKRFLEISEIAANEDRDKRETDMREGLMLSKFWAKFLSAKRANEMQKSQHVEQAFHKMKSVTGEYNVNELVHKFLTREQTFKELKQTIDGSRETIAELIGKNANIEKVINSVTIFDKESRTVDIFNLKEKYGSSFKELEAERNKLKELTAIYKHLVEWNLRMRGVFQINSEIPAKAKDLFQGLAIVIIEKIKSRKL